MTYFIKEVSEHIKALLGVVYFRVELCSVKSLFNVLNCGIGAFVAVTYSLEAVGENLDIIVVAHPYDRVFLKTVKYSTFCIKFALCSAEFCGGVLVSLADSTAKTVNHKLRTVADAEYRYSKFKYFFCHSGGVVKIYASRTAREDDALRILCLYLLNRCLV